MLFYNFLNSTLSLFKMSLYSYILARSLMNTAHNSAFKTNTFDTEDWFLVFEKHAGDENVMGEEVVDF